MEKDTSIMSNSMYYGLIFGLVLLVYNVITTLTGMTTKMMTSGFGMMALSLLLTLILYFAGIIISQRHYRITKLDNVMTYGQAFSLGILVTIFASFLVAVWNFVYAQWINPDFGQEVYELSRDMTINMLERMNAPEESFEAALESIESRGISTPADFAINAIFSGVIMGGIISLITSIFTKKTDNNPFAGVEDTDSE